MEKSFTQQCMRLRHVWLRPVRRAGVGRTGVGDAFGNALGGSVVDQLSQGSDQQQRLADNRALPNQANQQSDASYYGPAYDMGSGVGFNPARGGGLGIQFSGGAVRDWSDGVDTGIRQSARDLAWAEQSDAIQNRRLTEFTQDRGNRVLIAMRDADIDAAAAAQRARLTALAQQSAAQQATVGNVNYGNEGRTALRGVASNVAISAYASAVDGIPRNGYPTAPIYESSALDGLPSGVRRILDNAQALPGVGGGIRAASLVTIKGGAALASTAQALYAGVTSFANDVRVLGPVGAYLANAPAVNTATVVAAETALGYDVVTPGAVLNTAALRQPGLERLALPRTPGLGAASTTSELLQIGAIPGREGVVLTQRVVPYNDIWALTEKTGVEYALTKESGNWILRSGSQTSVPIPAGVRPTLHTHALDAYGVNSLQPSRADINILNEYWSINPNLPRPVSQILTGQESPTKFWATGFESWKGPKK